MRRIELTRAILVPRFILRNSTTNIHMFLYLVTCFLRVTVLLLCRLQAVSKIQAPIYPYLISEERWKCSTNCDRHCNQTVTLRKHVTKIKTFENSVCVWIRRSNLSENLIIVALKLLELTGILSANLITSLN